MKYIETLMALIFICLSIELQAANQQPVGADSTAVVQKKVTIIDKLADPDSETGAVVVVSQSPEINKVLFQSLSDDNANTVTKKGYRIQIYSSNMGQSARVEAFKIKKDVESKHPDIKVYTPYLAPFWKVRLGNCTTMSEATDLLNYIKDEYPQYETQTYIVPSEIEVNE